MSPITDAMTFGIAVNAIRPPRKPLTATSFAALSIAGALPPAFAALLASLRQRVEQAIEEDRVSYEESALLLRHLEQGLNSYTYLLTPDRMEPPTP